MLQVDCSALPAGVVNELIKGRLAKDALTLAKAQENQYRVAREGGTEWSSLDGLGAPTLNITAEAYHYWGRRLGYACWKDKQFLREFKRDNPACRINAKGTRIQSGAAGAVATAEGNKRFRKSYG